MKAHVILVLSIGDTSLRQPKHMGKGLRQVEDIHQKVERLGWNFGRHREVR